MKQPSRSNTPKRAHQVLPFCEKVNAPGVKRKKKNNRAQGAKIDNNKADSQSCKEKVFLLAFLLCWNYERVASVLS